MMLEWILSACLLILVVLALRVALRNRITAGLRYGLWVVVLARLLIPVSFFSLPVEAPTPLSWMPAETLQEESIYILPIESIPVESASAKPGENDGPEDPNSFGYARLEDGGQTITRYVDKISPIELLNLLWIAGAAATGCVVVFSNILFFRRLRRTRQRLESVEAPVRVYTAAGLPSPCLFGFPCPAVYVTEEIAGDSVMLRHVLTHELTHYRHWDHLWSLLRGIALAVHWWNPLVWVAVVCSRRDGELACDEGTLKRLGDDERTAYGETLLALVTSKSHPGDLLCFATTMTSGKRNLLERVRRIAHQPRQLACAVVVVAVVLSVSVLCAFGRVESKDSDPLLPPPGLCWNDSKEAVIDKLGITDAQIILNEPSEPLGPHDPEEWALHVQDFHMWGENATVGFNFIHYEGAADGYGLNRVVVIFPEDADMEAVRAELIAQYGEGEAGRAGSTAAFARLLPDAQELQSDLENHHMFWEIGTEVLPEEYVERVKEWQAARSTLSVEELERYLSETRLVGLSWTDDFPLRAGLVTSNRIEFDATTLVNFLQNVPLEGEKPVNTKTEPYDVNRDGIRESISGQYSGLVEKCELFQGDTVIWSDEVDRSNKSWNVYFRCRVDGLDYLLEYRPKIADGFYDYSYRLFHIEEGREVTDLTNQVAFDVHFDSPDHRFNPSEIAAFMEDVNRYITAGSGILGIDLGSMNLEGNEYKNVSGRDNILITLGASEMDYRTEEELREKLTEFAIYAADHPDQTWSPLLEVLLGITSKDMSVDADKKTLSMGLRTAIRTSRFYTWDSYTAACDGHRTREESTLALPVLLLDGSTLHLFAYGDGENRALLMILETPDGAYSAFYNSLETLQEMESANGSQKVQN